MKLLKPHRNDPDRTARRLILCLLAGLATGCALPVGAGQSSDFYICANINRNYVIGSTIVTTNGLFHLNNSSGEWSHLGYNDTTISAVAFDPRDHDLIYTSALNGIWRSLDGGETWRMTNSWDMTEGRDVAVDPNAPDTVYLALPDGVAVSIDRGLTWERREHGLPDRGKFTQTISVDRMTAGRVLAGCEKGVFLTTDAGRHWRQVLPTQTTVNDIEQSPHDPSHWLAVTDTHGASFSTDNGRHWQPITSLFSDAPIYNVTFDPTTTGRIAIASWAYGVWTSEDGGKSWTQRNAGLPEQPRAWRVGVNPNTGRLYASIYKETLFHSDDFGRTWQPDDLTGSIVNAFVSVPSIEEEQQ